MPCYGSRSCQAYEACPEGQCIILEAMEDARAEEREACAKICEETWVEPGDMQVASCQEAAEKIRSRI